MLKPAYAFFLAFFLHALFFQGTAGAALRGEFVSTWQIKNFSFAEFKDKRLTVKGLLDPEITIPTPNLNAADYYVMEMSAKTTNPMGLMRVMWKAGGRTRFYPIAQLPLSGDGEFNTYSIDLRARYPGIKLWNGEISTVSVTFSGFGDTVEIEDLAIKKPVGIAEKAITAWRNFFWPEAITPLSINSVSPPFLFAFSYVFILNIIAVTAALAALAAHLWKKRKKDSLPVEPRTGNDASRHEKRVSAIFIVLLLLWAAYDLRYTYDQAISTNAVYESYVRTKDERRRFSNMDDFYDFAEFARAQLKGEDKIFYFHGPAGRNFFAHMKYLLYPLKPVTFEKPGATKVHAVYKNPNVTFDNGMLYVDGNPVAKGKETARYDDYSFIFREENL
ncbi:MAG TPA: hypothetical protein VFF54_06200 [Thermodesulfobacteriota bacterium]|nr:hypothetical protein [Thermodesulfobacteriota bacterium]